MNGKCVRVAQRQEVHVRDTSCGFTDQALILFLAKPEIGEVRFPFVD
jgi:hypothetical protein